MSQALSEILKDGIVRVTQEAEQNFLGRGKSIQLSIQIMGDSAISKASAKNGDIFAALEYILDSLPEPKMFYLKTLAMFVTYQKIKSRRRAADYLGICRRQFSRKESKYPEALKQLELGTIELDGKIQNPGELPNET